MACATIGHSAPESAFCTALIANRCFDLCRSERLTVAGFPNFRKAVGELRNAAPPQQPEYNVTIAVGDALVVKQVLVEQWTAKADYKHEMEKLLACHNEKYNKRGLKRGSEVAGLSNRDSPTKKLCIEAEQTLDEYETKNPDRPGFEIPFPKF